MCNCQENASKHCPENLALDIVVIPSVLDTYMYSEKKLAEFQNSVLVNVNVMHKKERKKPSNVNTRTL